MNWNTDLTRADYIRKERIRFPAGLVTPATQKTYGGVTLFPTMFPATTIRDSLAMMSFPWIRVE